MLQPYIFFSSSKAYFFLEERFPLLRDACTVVKAPPSEYHLRHGDLYGDMTCASCASRTVAFSHYSG
jgi:hypothetical protein